MPTGTAPSDHLTLRETRFDHAALDALGVEWMSLSDLQRRVPPELMRLPERLDFYMCLLVTAGTGAHMVDFAHAPLCAGTVVFVRPGQVQQWQPGTALEGTLVLVAPRAIAPAPARPEGALAADLALAQWPAVTVLPGPVEREMRSAMEQLRNDFERFDHSALDTALIRHDAQALFMRLARWFASADPGTAAAPGRAVYRLFQRELETGFRERRGVQDFARRLGYSESTLTRACEAAEGRSAKQVIDRRVALEAARELVHSRASVAEIGHRLGFSEATNFVKFFRRMHGVSPLVFRQRVQRP